MNQKRESPLGVKIVDDQLQITIGIETLAFAAERYDYFWEGADDDVKVTDPDEFAKDVVRELESEEEDGTTLVHLMFDKAFRAVVENGGESIYIPKLDD